MAVNGINIKISDTKNFTKLNVIEKGLFEAFRDSILLIFPTEDDNKSFSDETILYCEKSAFEFVDKLPDEIRNPPTIEKLIEALTPVITSLISNATTAQGVQTQQTLGIRTIK